MGMLDDTALFVAVVQQGGFSHAARHLGLSSGLVSRRIAHLESKLGVTLLKRTTRQLHLTPEGKLFWQHSYRIQQELNEALSLIQSSAKKPKGLIRISAPSYFGRHYLTPLLSQFLDDFQDIKIDLVLDNQKLDLVKEQLDLVIRGAGYMDNETMLKDSSLQMRLITKEKICLYASTEYLLKHGEPKLIDELLNHRIISCMNLNHINQEKWNYTYDNKHGSVTFEPQFNCNDIDSALIACVNGCGIGKFTDFNAKIALQQGQLRPILTKYDFGFYHLYAIYPHQQALPRRTRLLLDFIMTHLKPS
ncbi:LysR family transcriptional regulator [Legionella longbeachae]|uniref:Putative transcriptional regulators, LysR family n=2 Tax=Legionella longbeachae TaxID=450 RepID=D3HMG5_LEGLN|nr:LysR family transcriptional regulator [Legionella longbeachae]EEZ96957.1 LysR family transcriptional regulator [Legionella longbeachae D-4968]CBJ13654.1 putative transcriptional regulators, LysR family [Legionella longbeachae NSW150]VEE04075.1 LysR family transcriptional regulator [Legionella oakridgensis]HBD7396934.1 LysR family transcriptional regulator [Legionella pneumophila]